MVRWLWIVLALGCAPSGGGGGDVDGDADVDADSDSDACPEPLVCGGDENMLDCHCNTNCTDTRTDPTNCGACFLNCNVEEGESSACVDGHCMCGDSPNRCGGSFSDFCCPSGGVAACVNLLTDEANCGVCGTACAAPLSNMCRSGVCVCGVPDNPDITPAACAAPLVCCGDGAAATCQPAGSC